MKFFIIVIIGTFIYTAITHGKVRYDNYRLYKIFTENEHHLNIVKSFHKNHTGNVHFWSEPSKLNSNIDVMVSPDLFSELHELLATLRLKSDITIENIQKLIDEGRPTFSNKTEIDWKEYPTFYQIYKWLDKIENDYPLEVSPFNVGKSYEGRDIRGVKISYKSDNPAIFIEANIHGREWISSATITWIMKELLTSSDPSVRDLAENIDWYIVPISNPDGFIYSHDVDRMWRKTRQQYTENCFGADPNRNFDFLWMAAGASTDPCSDEFAGSEPNSEVEVKALSNFIETLPVKINIFLAIHSYSQKLLSPWGHTNSEFPNNYDNMMEVASEFAKGAKKLYGTKYKFGSSAKILNKVSGTSKDWAYGARGIPLSYTMELRDQGQYGFLLPPNQIIPTAEETLDGLKGFVKAAKNLNYM